MFDFQEKELMMEVKHASVSSVLFDLRTAQQKSDALHNNQTSSLNHQELNVFIHRPAFVHQQPSIDGFNNQVFMLEIQKIILRTNSLDEESMTLSLLGASLPFPLLRIFQLEREFDHSIDITNLVPATYSRATTQQDEQSFVVATCNQLIRYSLQFDGWRVHSKKEKPKEVVIACSILPDDKVLVAML